MPKKVDPTLAYIKQHPSLRQCPQCGQVSSTGGLCSVCSVKIEILTELQHKIEKAANPEQLCDWADQRLARL